jgi:TM2 domain-containing membrane protein YozV
MKTNYTQKFGIALTAVALFLASCGSNATFSKRYHNRGFNIAWGGGADATPAKPVAKKARIEAEKSAIVENSSIEIKGEEIASYLAPLSPVTGANTPAVVANKPVVFATKATEVAAPAQSIEKKAVDQKVMVKATTKVLKQKKAMADPGSGKSQIVALILFVFFGTIGIHRFYLGHTKSGLLMLLLAFTLILPVINIFTGLGLLIWWVLDLIKLVTGDLKPADGEYTDTL